MYTRESNEEFLTQLFEQHYNAVYRLISNRLYASVDSSRDTEDLVQEVFIKAAEKIIDLRDHPKPRAWLYRTAKHCCQNYAKSYYTHQKKLRESAERRGKPDTGFDECETLDYLRSKLSEEDYALLRDYCLERLPKDELSRKYGVSKRTLANKVSIIRNKLSKFFIFLVIFVLVSTYKNGAC